METVFDTIEYPDGWWGRPRTMDPLLYTSGPTVPGGAGFAVFCRVMEGQGYCSRIGLIVDTQSGTFGVGVFRDNGSDAPGTLVAQTGDITVPASGPQTVSLTSSCEIREGDWIGLAASGTGSRFKGIATASNLPTWRVVFRNNGGQTFASNPSGLSADSRCFLLWGEK